MNRDQILEALLVDHLVDAFERDHTINLRDAYARGRSRFAALSTEELLAEARSRMLDLAAGILRENGAAAGEDCTDADDPAALLAGLGARDLRLRGEEA